MTTLFLCANRKPGSVLAISDMFEFTWRHQLPALVTLPPARGALGIGLIITAGKLAQASEEVGFGD